VDSGSPKSGSPGNSRRALRMNATTPGLRFVARHQCAALFRPGRRPEVVAEAAEVTNSGSVCEGSPGSGSRGAASTSQDYVDSAQPGNDARRAVSQLAVKARDHAVGTPGWNLHNSVYREALNRRQRALSKVIVRPVSSRRP
jgi:hypothetical protein